MKDQELQSLKYVELQKRAKSAGIRANQKVDKLIQALAEYYTDSEEQHVAEKQAENAVDITQVQKMDLSQDSPAPSTVTENRGKKRRRTFELEQPTLKGDGTPTIENDQPRTRLQTSRNSTPQNETQGQPVKRLRRSTFDKNSPAPQDNKSSVPDNSPSTKAIIDSIQSDCSSAERKQKLLSAIDKKVQLKMASSPSNHIRAQGQPSQIPRFMAFLNKKKESQKPLTPGNKDWNKIHKKEFSKFDSIDVYLEKKVQRKENLSASGKKQWTKKFPAVQKPSTRIVKPVQKEPVSSKMFKPTIISTKNINFDFSKMASDSSKTPKAKAVNTPSRKNVPTSTKLKDSVSTNRATPFKFTGNQSSLNTTVTSSKKNAFDLKASLSRPLSWKPHTGKLQTVDFNIGHNVSVTKSSSVTTTTIRKQRKVVSRDSASKMRPRQAKDIRRAAHLDRRTNQKYVDMMKRRGLMA